MSINSLNAEHRGGINSYPQLIRRQYRCLFCRLNGHNITTCNSPRLRDFEVTCATQVSQTNTQEDFKNWLIEYYSSEELLIKTFAIKKFRVTTRVSIENCMELISNYIFRIYKNMNENVEMNEDEDEVTSFIRETGIQENIRISEIRAIENLLMREIFIIMMSGFINRIIINEDRKLQIVLTINNHEDENLNQLCECNICYDEKELKNFVKLTCNHEFCKDCIINTMKTMNTNNIRNLTCAFCRKDVKTIESRTNDVKNEFNNYIE